MVEAGDVKLLRAHHGERLLDPGVFKNAEAAAAMNDKTLHHLDSNEPIRVVVERLAVKRLALLLRLPEFPAKNTRHAKRPGTPSAKPHMCGASPAHDTHDTPLTVIVHATTHALRRHTYLFLVATEAGDVIPCMLFRWVVAPDV